MSLKIANKQFTSTNLSDVSRRKRFVLRCHKTMDVLVYRLWEVWLAVRRPILRAALESIQRWHIFRSTFRSFRGHIQTLHTTKHLSVDLGPAFQRSPSGHLLVCTQTVGHSDGTKHLLTTFPWADLVDLQVFLLGFDEGAKWAQSISDNASSRPGQTCDSVTTVSSNAP